MPELTEQELKDMAGELDELRQWKRMAETREDDARRKIESLETQVELLRGIIDAPDVTADPEEAKPFWMISVDGGGASTVCHSEFESARAEAVRLAKSNPPRRVYILESVAFVRSAVKTAFVAMGEE